MERATLLVLLTVSLCACDAEDDRALTATQLVGVWRGPCDPLPADDAGDVAYAQSTIINDGERGGFRFSLYGDAACTFELVRFRITSQVSLGAERPDVAPGAYDLDVAFEQIHATPFVDGLVALLEMAGCGSGEWMLGVEQDVSATGCLSFAPRADCPSDYDLVRVRGDELQTGVRGGDQCVPSGRPTALNEWVFTRVE